MNARYLTATLRIPVRISLEGDLTLLNEYAQISVGEMDGWRPTKTNETIYSKVIQYLSAEEDDELGKVCEKMEEELDKKEKEEKEETKEEIEEEEEEIKEEETKEKEEDKEEETKEEEIEEEEDKEEETKEEEEDKEEEIKEKEETKEEEEEIKEEETKEEEKKEEPQIVMHEFSYFKKSKKPLNATFRARIKSQNFTKKVYGS
jgi:hypothetical protein